MKKYLFLLTALCAGLFAACDEMTEDGQCSSCLTPPAQEQLIQSSYADEESTGTGFTFQTANVWQAIVREKPSFATPAKVGTRAGESIANDAVWLKLLNNGVEAYTGGAGVVNLQIEMEQNYTGEDRFAAITVTSGNGSFTVNVEQKAIKADSTMNEAPVPVTEIRLNQEKMTLKSGEKATLQATVLPNNATLKTVKWTCQDSLVARVNPKTGEITALGAGTTLITATSLTNKEISASCELTVEPSELPTDSTATDGTKIARIEIAHWYSYGEGNVESDGKEIYNFYYDAQGRPVKIAFEEDDEEVENPGFPGDSTRYAARKARRRGIKRISRSDSTSYITDKTIIDITYGQRKVSYIMTDFEDGEERPYKDNGEATLDANGRVTKGSVTYWDYKEDNYGNPTSWYSETNNYQLTYNSTGQLTKMDWSDGAPQTISWTNGNLTLCDWGEQPGECQDKATYSNLPNNTNLDINHANLLSYGEGFMFATGDDTNIFSLIGLTGSRSKNMVSTVTESFYGNEYLWEFEYEVQNGLITKIIVWETLSYSGRYKCAEMKISY